MAMCQEVRMPGAEFEMDEDDLTPREMRQRQADEVAAWLNGELDDTRPRNAPVTGRAQPPTRKVVTGVDVGTKQDLYAPKPLRTQPGRGIQVISRDEFDRSTLDDAWWGRGKAP
jgi:hypothetical protein